MKKFRKIRKILQKLSIIIPAELEFPPNPDSGNRFSDSIYFRFRILQIVFGKEI